MIALEKARHHLEQLGLSQAAAVLESRAVDAPSITQGGVTARGVPAGRHTARACASRRAWTWIGRMGVS